MFIVWQLLVGFYLKQDDTRNNLATCYLSNSLKNIESVKKSVKRCL